MSTWNSPPQIEAFKQVQGINQEQQMNNIVNYMKQIANVLSALKNDIEYMLNGNLDVNNVRAKGLSAETLDVEELSAISANLGTITAGLMQAVTIIGSYIATATPGVYPRSEMSVSDDLFAIYLTVDKYLKISPSGWGGSPGLRFSNGNILEDSGISNPSSGLLIESEGSVTIRGKTGPVRLTTQSLYGVRVDNWGEFRRDDTGVSLQTEINNIYTAIAGKANSFAGYTGSYSDGTNMITVENGIITSVT